MDVLIPAGFENLQSTGKEDVVREMCRILAQEHLDPVLYEEVVKLIMDRERLGTTGIMNEVGVPHAKHGGIPRIILCVGRSYKGIDFEALDDKPVKLLFLLISPKSAAAEHLEVLAKISIVIKDEKLMARLKEASAEEIIERLKEV